MEKKKLTYYFLFSLIVFSVSLAGFFSRSSNAAYQSEPVTDNIYFSYRHIASQADSSSNVEFLTEKKNKESRNEKNGSEENKGLINDLLERGLKSFPFTFPNIFDFL